MIEACTTTVVALCFVAFSVTLHAHVCIHILAWDECFGMEKHIVHGISVIISLINVNFCGYMNFLWCMNDILSSVFTECRS